MEKTRVADPKVRCGTCKFFDGTTWCRHWNFFTTADSPPCRFYRSRYGGPAMSPMQKGSMPKPGPEALAAFDSIVPAAPGVTKRPMFGNRAAFVNGNMFAGLFGDGLFVRLPEPRLQEVFGQGGRPFEPMPGRAMKGYAFVPEGWLSDPRSAAPLVDEALDYASALPPKR